jgi:hypothetical protein
MKVGSTGCVASASSVTIPHSILAVSTGRLRFSVAQNQQDRCGLVQVSGGAGLFEFQGFIPGTLLPGFGINHRYGGGKSKPF